MVGRPIYDRGGAVGAPVDSSADVSSPRNNHRWRRGDKLDRELTGCRIRTQVTFSYVNDICDGSVPNGHHPLTRRQRIKTGRWLVVYRTACGGWTRKRKGLCRKEITRQFAQGVNRFCVRVTSKIVVWLKPIVVRKIINRVLAVLPGVPFDYQIVVARR